MALSRVERKLLCELHYETHYTHATRNADNPNAATCSKRSAFAIFSNANAARNLSASGRQRNYRSIHLPGGGDMLARDIYLIYAVPQLHNQE